jgi:hypothetical protein
MGDCKSAAQGGFCISIKEASFVGEFSATHVSQLLKRATGMETESNPGDDIPKDAQVVAALLKSMGVQEWEPRVVNQLMEFMNTYVSDILNDSKVCCWIIFFVLILS